MSSSPANSRRSATAWSLLIVSLAIEAVGGLVLLISIVPNMLAATEEPMGPRLSIFLAILISWVWVCVTLGGSVRSRASWVRGSAITIHVLLFAAGTGLLQLGLASSAMGWGLVLLALIGFFSALLARPTVHEISEIVEQ